MLTQAVLDDLRKRLMERVAYAQYSVGPVAKTAPIEAAYMLDDGCVCIEFVIDASSGGETVSQVRLYDADDTLLASKGETIICNPDLGGVYYRFYFRINEVT